MNRRSFIQGLLASVAVVPLVPPVLDASKVVFHNPITFQAVKSIDCFEFSTSTGQFYIHFTDHSVLGPYDLPVFSGDLKPVWISNES